APVLDSVGPISANVTSCNTPPSGPLLQSPVGTLPAGTDPVAFSWQAVDGAEDYRIRVWASATPSDVLVDTTITTTSLAPAVAFDPGVEYTWQVSAQSAAWCGPAESPTQAFTIDEPVDCPILPQAPELLAPLGARPASELPPRFDWSAVNGANSYRLQVWAQANPANLLLDQPSLTVTEFQASSLDAFEPDVNYIWQVLVNADGCDPVASTTAGFRFESAVVPGPLPDVDPAPLNLTTLHSRPSHNPAVGALQGEAGVSGGAATYTVGINVPPGRAGMQPALAIGYNSRAGNGKLGMGFSLNGLSQIHRCPATVAQDGAGVGIRFADTDRLCLDGQRLVVVSGNYWGAGSEYRTEIESFVRVRMNGSGIDGNNISFTLRDKDGNERLYGQTQASRAAPRSPLGARRTTAWLLNRETDPSGNRIDWLRLTGNAG
ncbi:MAG: hypothetical protein LC637_07415, partial [Xanthomonadaceae bacterium]|nr:hypothetical protein [Xanthomonadaceae bacterium]